MHEVGHNWFYGILGSNERVHGWMDVSMTDDGRIIYLTTNLVLDTKGGKYLGVQCISGFYLYFLDVWLNIKVFC